MRTILGLVLAAALTGCASLTAEAPLFPPGGEYGPMPVEPGVWIRVSDECPESRARRRGNLPQACGATELRPAPDGALHVQVKMEDEEGALHDAILRVVLAPAVENGAPGVYAPLYVAELVQIEPAPEGGPAYAVIGPIGELPARAFYLIASIGCDDIFRAGPIEGVRDERVVRASDWEPDESVPQARPISDGRCVAASQAGVREAARRALIEELPQLHEMRMVWARPLPQ